MKTQQSPSSRLGSYLEESGSVAKRAPHSDSQPDSCHGSSASSGLSCTLDRRHRPQTWALAFPRNTARSPPSLHHHSNFFLPLSVCNTSPKSWGEAKVALSRDSCCREPEAFRTEHSSGAGWAPRGNPISNCSRQFSEYDRERRFQLAI